MLLVLSDFDAGGILLHRVRVDTLVTLRDYYGRMDISVSALCQCYLFDETVHQRIQLWILCDGIDCGTCFEPFVHVAVVEGRTVVLALNGACCYLEVSKAVAAMLAVGIQRLIGCVPSVPHGPDTGRCHDIKTVGPETTRPLGSPHRQVLHLSLLAMTHVCQALS